MYIETSSPRKRGDFAQIASPVFKPNSKCKVRFFYHMYGQHIGSLNIKTRTSVSGAMTQQWSLSGNQGNSWKRAEVLLSLTQNFQVCFYMPSKY